MTRRLLPACEARHEIVISKSRFIASAAPAFTLEEARGFLERIRGELAGATHHVPAFVIGHGASVVAHCHDDGEPAGTAGRPALAVVQGSGLGDIAVVVTRYFGGVKLGTGGLVRAYSGAVRDLFSVLPIGEMVETRTLLMEVPYPAHRPVRRALDKHGAEILEEEFGSMVRTRACLAESQAASLQAEVARLTRGACSPEIVGSGTSIVRIEKADLKP